MERMLFFIFTEGFGFESVTFDTLEAAEKHAKELRQLAGYRKQDIGVRQVTPMNLFHATGGEGGTVVSYPARVSTQGQ